MQHLFGTDGIRGQVGESPLTAPELVTLGASIGAWMYNKHPHPRILVAHDTRYSASFIKAALKAGLFQYPVILYDAESMPTPALFHQVMHGPYDYGIMITASHNPYLDNGIKIITKENGKLTDTDEQELHALYAYNPHLPFYEQLGQEHSASTAATDYFEALRNYFPIPFLQGITLVLDCANGAYASHAPRFLEELGAKVIPVATTPNGKNINKECGSLHPQRLQHAVITHGAQAGFAFDGDGDRLMVVTQKGVCKDGDELLAFLLHHPTYKEETTIVGTILSNQGLSSHLQTRTKTLYRTPVGDKHVIQKMKDCGALLGGEPSGHLILRDFTDTADGLFTLLRVAQTACLLNDWNFSSFAKFPQVTLNLPVACKKDLHTDPYHTIINTHQATLSEGRVIVRYSGTEPLLRIMIESPDQEKAYAVGTLLSQQLLEAFSKE
jgi:phosphoglucosamine mutase